MQVLVGECSLIQAPEQAVDGALCACLQRLPRSPSSALFPFFEGGFPYQNRLQAKQIGYPSSTLSKDLVADAGKSRQLVSSSSHQTPQAWQRICRSRPWKARGLGPEILVWEASIFFRNRQAFLAKRGWRTPKKPFTLWGSRFF